MEEAIVGVATITVAAVTTTEASVEVITTTTTTANITTVAISNSSSLDRVEATQQPGWQWPLQPERQGRLQQGRVYWHDVSYSS